MVQLVEVQGLTFEAAAAASNVAKSTVWEWVRRWRAASPAQRGSLACLADRPSTPRRSPRMLSEADHERICEVRRRTGWGPRLIAAEVELPHSTVHRALRRRGCSRPPRAPREAVVRYEWHCPGDRLHMDTKRFARFSSPGHAVTGDRHRTGAEKRARVGYDFAHSIVDDHSRLAYTELHPDQRAATVTAFMKARAGLPRRPWRQDQASDDRPRARIDSPLTIPVPPDLLERLHPGLHPFRGLPFELQEHRTVGRRSDEGGATSSVHTGATSDVRSLCATASRGSRSGRGRARA
jgi:transposase